MKKLVLGLFLMLFALCALPAQAHVQSDNEPTTFSQFSENCHFVAEVQLFNYESLEFDREVILVNSQKINKQFVPADLNKTIFQEFQKTSKVQNIKGRSFNEENLVADNILHVDPGRFFL